MSAADAVTAAEARALLDAVEGLSGPALFTLKEWTWTTSPEEAAALRAAGALFAAAPALARTVIALHENIEFLHSNMDSALGHIDLARAERARERKNAAARERLLTRRTDALRAAERERDALRAEVEGLRAWKSATISAAYEVVKMHDDGPECWPEWFEGYGVDGLCAAMYPEAPHG